MAQAQAPSTFFGGSGGGGSSDTSLGELAIVQAMNAQSVGYAWRLIDDASGLSGSLDRLYGMTVTSNTIAEIAASSADMAALLANAEALASMAKSNDFCNAVVASSTAMNEIAATAATLRAVFAAPELFGAIMADATARGTLTASTALSAVTIPDHSTGVNSSGVGEISASSIQSSSAGASYAVDSSVSGSYWVPDSHPAWLEYEFNSPCFIHTAAWHRGTFGSNKPESGTLQAYVDGAWRDIVDMPVSGSGVETVYLPETFKSTRWRINNVSRSSGNVLVSDFRLYGFYD